MKHRETSLQMQKYIIRLTAVSAGPASSMTKTPSVVILTPSRDDIRSVQPSETENQHLSAALIILLTVYVVCCSYSNNMKCMSWGCKMNIGVENEITIQFHPTPVRDALRQSNTLIWGCCCYIYPNYIWFVLLKVTVKTFSSSSPWRPHSSSTTALLCR